MEPNKISYYRKKMGLTQEELARKINISRSSIAQYENGARSPNEETLEKMSELFNCFTSELKTKKYYIKETISFLLSIFMGIVSLLILISFIFIDDLFPKISMIYYPYVVPIMIFVVYGLMTLIICISKIKIGKNKLMTLPADVFAENATHTARHTKTLQKIPLINASENVSVHFAAAVLNTDTAISPLNISN